MFCPKCGKGVSGHTTFCGSCGSTITRNSDSNPGCNPNPNRYMNSFLNLRIPYWVIPVIVVVIIALTFGIYHMTKSDQEQPTLQYNHQQTVNGNQDDSENEDINSSSKSANENAPATGFGSDKITAQAVALAFEADRRFISEDELTGFGKWELDILRNCIYARHGRPFKRQDLQNFFNSQDWYSMDISYSDSRLNNFEKQNVAAILKYQQKSGKV